MPHQTQQIASSVNGQNPLKKVAIGVAYCGTVTVLPFLRVPGTAGAQFFRFWAAVAGCTLMYLFCIFTEAGAQPFCLKVCAVASLAATFVQLVVCKITSGSNSAVPPKHVGRSIVHLLAPEYPERPAIMVGELIVLVCAGFVFWFAQMEVVATWLWFGSVCNSLYYHWSFPTVEWVDPHSVKQIACRVVSRSISQHTGMAIVSKPRANARGHIVSPQLRNRGEI